MAERAKKQRLVPSSSQESQDSDEAVSRKSSRKRTALTKLGGVITDSIFKTRRNKGEGEKERDTNKESDVQWIVVKLLKRKLVCMSRERADSRV